MLADQVAEEKLEDIDCRRGGRLLEVTVKLKFSFIINPKTMTEGKSIVTEELKNVTRKLYAQHG